MEAKNDWVWHIGIDEAGYGPNLGPLVQAAVAIRVPREKFGAAPGEMVPWWDWLEDSTTREKRKAGKKLLVDDSKEVFSAGKRGEGLQRLENALLMLGITPVGKNLWESLAPFWIEDAAEAAELWHDPGLSFPEIEITPERQKQLDAWNENLVSTGLGPIQIRIRMVFPKAFNQAVERSDSKATVLTDGVGKFLQWGTGADEKSGLAQPGDGIHAVVDKLGGRDRYGPWLGSILGGWVTPGEESLGKSTYRITFPQREMSVSFESKADQNHMPVALASMVAKYLRERHMDSFNLWWQSKIDGLAPTAGYPQDAKRFLENVGPRLNELGVPMEVLWRQR